MLLLLNSIHCLPYVLNIYIYIYITADVRRPRPAPAVRRPGSPTPSNPLGDGRPRPEHHPRRVSPKLRPVGPRRSITVVVGMRGLNRVGALRGCDAVRRLVAGYSGSEHACGVRLGFGNAAQSCEHAFAPGESRCSDALPWFCHLSVLVRGMRVTRRASDAGVAHAATIRPRGGVATPGAALSPAAALGLEPRPGAPMAGPATPARGSLPYWTSRVAP